tara:strand:- start:747 stop:1406 length:660 start_codon:yes stop_codon:yes gene_type:complete
LLEVWLTFPYDRRRISVEGEPGVIMSQVSEDRIIGLWGTPFLHFTPEAHATHQNALASLAESSPDADLLHDLDTSAQWLRTQINAAVTAFLERWAEADPGRVDIVSRTLIHGHSDYQPLRNHPDAYLSGLYYIEVPQGVRDPHHRSDADSNALSFYDPRFGINMGAIAKDPNSQMEKQVQPTAGVMIIWPSHVDYFMHPNLSASSLIAIQFNAKLETTP